MGLHVGVAGDPHGRGPAGAVEWIAPNLLRGSSDQPHQDAQVFDAQRWHTLCANAYRAFAERRTV